MSALLTINGHSTPAPPGATIFDCAESLGVRIPTSCQKQGKCRECLVEVVEGLDALSPRTPEEKHLDGRFRLSCRAAVLADSGAIECHTMRRGDMRIDLAAGGMPVTAASLPPDPLPDSAAPYGIAADIGTTTVVLRLYHLATGRLV